MSIWQDVRGNYDGVCSETPLNNLTGEEVLKCCDRGRMLRR